MWFSCVGGEVRAPFLLMLAATAFVVALFWLWVFRFFRFFLLLFSFLVFFCVLRRFRRWPKWCFVRIRCR